MIAMIIMIMTTAMIMIIIDTLPWPVCFFHFWEACFFSADQRRYVPCLGWWLGRTMFSSSPTRMVKKVVTCACDSNPKAATFFSSPVRWGLLNFMSGVVRPSFFPAFLPSSSSWRQPFTASRHVQCSLPSVFPAEPQPRTSALSVSAGPRPRYMSERMSKDMSDRMSEDCLQSACEVESNRTHFRRWVVCLPSPDTIRLT